MWWRVLSVINRVNLFLSLLILNKIVMAVDTTDIEEVNALLKTGQSMIKVAAKWGGILTVVGAALALGGGRLEGALAQTICKILIVIGLLASATSFFGGKIGWGFCF